MSQLLGSLYTARMYKPVSMHRRQILSVDFAAEVYTSDSQLAISNYIYNSKYFLTYSHERLAHFK